MRERFSVNFRVALAILCFGALLAPLAALSADRAPLQSEGVWGAGNAGAADFAPRKKRGPFTGLSIALGDDAAEIVETSDFELFSGFGVDDMALRFGSTSPSPEWVDLDSISLSFGLEADPMGGLSDARAGAGAAFTEGAFSFQTEIAVSGPAETGRPEVFGGVSLHLEF